MNLKTPQDATEETFKDAKQKGLDGIVLVLQVYGNNKVANAPIFLHVACLLIKVLLGQPFETFRQEEMFSQAPPELLESVMEKIEIIAVQLGGTFETTKRELIISLAEMCLAHGTLKPYVT